MFLQPLKKKEEPKPQVETPLVVDVSIDAASGGRVIKITIPPYREYSDEDRASIESTRGKSAVAICDVTGELIFDAKNANVLRNDSPDRKEFNGLTISTRFLRELLDKINLSKHNSSGEAPNGGPREARQTAR